MTTETHLASYVLPDFIQRYEAQLVVQANLKREIGQLKKQVEHYLQQVPNHSLPMTYGKLKLQTKSQRGAVTQAYLETCLTTYLKRQPKVAEAEARHFAKGAATFVFKERPRTESVTLFRAVSKRKGSGNEPFLS